METTPCASGHKVTMKCILRGKKDDAAIFDGENKIPDCNPTKISALLYFFKEEEWHIIVMQFFAKVIFLI